MPWKQTKVVEERRKLVLAMVARREPVRVICRHFGVSRQSAYKFLRRFEREGVAGLRDQLRGRRSRARWQENPAVAAAGTAATADVGRAQAAVELTAALPAGAAAGSAHDQAVVARGGRGADPAPTTEVCPGGAAASPLCPRQQ